MQSINNHRSKCGLHLTSSPTVPLTSKANTYMLASQITTSRAAHNNNIQGLVMNKQLTVLSSRLTDNFLTHEFNPLANRKDINLQSAAESHNRCTDPAELQQGRINVGKLVALAPSDPAS